MDMADGNESEDCVPSRPMSAMGIEIEPDLETPLLGTLEPLIPQSRVASLLVLLAFIIVVIVLAAMMGHLSSLNAVSNVSPLSTQPP